MIGQIIAYNKEFVAQKGYEKYLTSKYPDKKLAVLPSSAGRNFTRSAYSPSSCSGLYGFCLMFITAQTFPTHHSAG